MDTCVELQKTVRDNASDLQNYMLDLKNWEDGAKQKERNVVYGIPKDEKKDKKTVTRSDVEYVKAAFEDGSRQMKNKKWDLAEASFSKAIRKYNKNPAFFIKRSKCYLKLKKPDEAETDCTTALAIDPKILKAKYQRSQAREMKGNLRGACLDLQDVLILDPSNQLAKDAFSRLKPLFDKSQQKDGCKSFEQEEDSASKQSIGDTILESLAGAEDPYEAAALNEEKTQIANAEKEKGNQFVKEEKWEDAIEAYSKAIEYNPNEPIFYANRALCFLKTKQEHRAILDCCMALKKNPRYVKVYMRRAAAKKATSDYWGARSDVKQVLTLEPNNTQAKSDLEELNLLIEKSFGNKTKEVPLSSKTKEGKTTVEDGKPEDAVVKKSLEYITLLPVNKPVHLRSKKPLKRIPIKFIDEILPSKKLANVSSKFFLSNDEMDEIKKNAVLKKNEKIDREKTVIPHPEKHLKNENKQINLAKNAEVTPVKKEIIFPNEIKFDCNPSSLKGVKYVLPVFKKPHLRSKKPLLRIPIRFI